MDQLHRLWTLLSVCLVWLPRVAFFRRPTTCPPGTWVFFPILPNRPACGLAGILEIAEPDDRPPVDVAGILEAIGCLEESSIARHVAETGALAASDIEALDVLDAATRSLRSLSAFIEAYQPSRVAGLREAGKRFEALIEREDLAFAAREAELSSRAVERLNAFLIRLRDVAWRLTGETLPAVDRVEALVGSSAPAKLVREMRKVDAVLASIDRMEIRGRDSAGISVMATCRDADGWDELLERNEAELAERMLPDLPNGSVRIGSGALFFVYKVAKEIGSLGDNIRALRADIAEDDVLADVLSDPSTRVQVLAHTRWASNGIINIPNCHPVDNESQDLDGRTRYRSEVQIQAALNGDIDNYQDLRYRLEESQETRIRPSVTTDAKIIGLWIEARLLEGHSFEEAFRLAVSDFEGSAAIAVHSDRAPDSFLLSLKGSGQALYVAFADGCFFFSSELYGFVEHTDEYVKLDGGGGEDEGGQMAILTGAGEFRLFDHDGTPVDALERKRATITTRDIDRADYDHFFLKEINEAPLSVRKTFRGRLLLREDGLRLNLGEEILPGELKQSFVEGAIRRIYVIGQGTASIAGMGIARAMADDLRGAGIRVQALKASELSGFAVKESMDDCLVVAVTQSGTTTDTNRAVEVVKSQGARTLAIVNRRGSDVSDKVEGVLYTSDGRDIEMSVASTKAFYSQVAAGMLLSLALSELVGAEEAETLEKKARSLSTLPDLLERTLLLAPVIQESAEAIAPRRKHWAVVGSGPNQVAAHEVRIKLSELCYKSVACDVVEDKKHIDLSAEPLILVCAAGSPESVLGDIVKDVAIFQAHKALTFVVASEEEDRFTPYVDGQVLVPQARPELSLILNTMAGHLFGYYAALAINRSATLLQRIRSLIVEKIEPDGARDNPLRLLHARTRRSLGQLGSEFTRRVRRGGYRTALNPDTATEISLLLKYATGKLDLVSFSEEFELPSDYGAVVEALLLSLREGIEELNRPIDAIKHQAKTVTVGTSRITTLPPGVAFDALREADVRIDDLDYKSVATLQIMQPGFAEVKGWTRYEIVGLSDEGLIQPTTRIQLVERRGIARQIPSRVERLRELKGTKRTIVQTRRIKVTVGKHDGREIAIIPVLDESRHVKELFLLHLDFVESLPRHQKLLMLEPVLDELKNGVVEQDLAWDDAYIDDLTPRILLTRPVESLIDTIVENHG